MMSVLVIYKVDSREDDIVMYCSDKSTIKDIQERIRSIINKDCKILYVKF